MIVKKRQNARGRRDEGTPIPFRVSFPRRYSAFIVGVATIKWQRATFRSFRKRAVARGRCGRGGKGSAELARRALVIARAGEA